MFIEGVFKGAIFSIKSENQARNLGLNFPNYDNYVTVCQQNSRKNKLVKQQALIHDHNTSKARCKRVKYCQYRV